MEENTHGAPEYFQKYSNDPYLGKPGQRNNITPAYDTMPVRVGITIKEYFARKYHNINRLINVEE